MPNPKKNRKRNKRQILFENKELIMVLGLFLVLVIFITLAAWVLQRDGYLSFFELLTTKAAAFMINLVGIKARVDGTTVSLPHATWVINLECTALFIMIIFASFIIAYPADVKDKAIALVLGVPFIFTVNILRLIVLAGLTEVGASFARVFHDYVWQVGFILLVVVLWLAWVNKVVNRARKAVVPD